MYGEVIRNIRIRSGMTQKQLANTAGVALNTVKNLESGKLKNPTLSTLVKIADAVGCKLTIGEVLTYDNRGDLQGAGYRPGKNTTETYCG